MSQTTTYKCDRCGGESQESAFLQSVTATIRWRNTDWQSTVIAAEWCDGCTEELNIRKPAKKSPTPHPRPCLEEIIRNIAREEIGGAA